MLCGKVHLKVRRSPVLCRMRCRCLFICRFSCHNFSVFNTCDQILRFCLFVDRPAVSTSWYFHCLSCRRSDRSRCSDCIISFSEISHPCPDSFFIECYIHISIRRNPCRNKSFVYNYIFFHRIGNTCLTIFIHIVTRFLNFFWFRCIFRYFIAFFIQKI